ncbi:MAG: Na(+)-translocating NADH-quinone reductase subunit C [bacterium]|nr:MAG: Na(+)-translocating NADH-quinone reductase subunit C [bacterium]
MSAERRSKIIAVALGVCIVCSILVSTAAVVLNAKQEENKKIEKIKNILIAGNLYEKGKDVKEIYNSKVEGTIIDLESGQKLDESKYNEELNVETFDIKDLAGSPQYGKIIPSAQDIAKIKRMPKYMAVYFVKEADELRAIIIPVYGKGLWSTMYGFIALDSDLRTIEGFTFYEHGETPGLGGEVDNPNWKRIWKGKKAFGDEGEVKIEVIKGRVDPSSQEAMYQVDGLSGSTLTTRGVDNLVKFWLGENGYGPFFDRLREESSHEQI